ncbi:MAG TPA: hypothetical protein VFM69_10635 [Pricia sp.]|nr:hypothetical protein [Pricia sp.]
MESDKTVYVIHAPDGDQHLGNVQNILELLKNERRIAAHAAMESDTVTAESLATIGTEDMVLMLLTDGITSNKVQIEEWLLKLRDKHSGVRVAEVIVDNIPYEEQFIAFPTDLEPIRSRGDMDRVWKKIGDGLRSILPVEEMEPTPPAWKKWVPYVLGILVLGGLIYLISQSGLMGKAPKAEFAYLVKDPIHADPIPNAEGCYIPCRVYLTDQSVDAETLRWDLKDTIIENEKQAQFVFKEAGDYEMVLEASRGNKKDKKAKTLKVKAPPRAGFEVENNGCTAPCEVAFKNTSENATKFSWTFAGTDPNTSTEQEPGKRKFTNDGKFTVTLNVENEEGIKSSFFKEITILRDNSPFADFTLQKITRGFPSVQKYRFVNQSKNATQYIWEVSKVGVSSIVKTYNTKSPVHQFSGYGTYTVKLTVRNASGQTNGTFKPVTLSKFQIYQINNLEYLQRSRSILSTKLVLPAGGRVE